MWTQSLMLTLKAPSKFYKAYTLSLPIRQVKSVNSYELEQQLLVFYDERSAYISHSSQKLPMHVTIVLVNFVPQLCTSKNKNEQYCADQYNFSRVWAFSCDKLRVVARAPSTAANRGGCTCFKFDFCRTIILESSVIIKYWTQTRIAISFPIYEMPCIPKKVAVKCIPISQT